MTPYGATCWHMTVRKWNLYPSSKKPWSSSRRIDHGQSGVYVRGDHRHMKFQRAERAKARRDSNAERDAQWVEWLNDDPYYDWPYGFEDGCDCEICEGWWVHTRDSDVRFTFGDVMVMR